MMLTILISQTILAGVELAQNGEATALQLWLVYQHTLAVIDNRMNLDLLDMDNVVVGAIIKVWIL